MSDLRDTVEANTGHSSIAHVIAVGGKGSSERQVAVVGGWRQGEKFYDADNANNKKSFRTRAYRRGRSFSAVVVVGNIDVFSPGSHTDR